MISGAVMILAAFLIFVGNVFGRIVGVLAGSMNLHVQLGSLDHNTFWSVMVVFIDILVIYGLVAHGGRIQDDWSRPPPRPADLAVDAMQLGAAILNDQERQAQDTLLARRISLLVAFSVRFLGLGPHPSHQPDARHEPAQGNDHADDKDDYPRCITHRFSLARTSDAWRDELRRRRSGRSCLGTFCNPWPSPHVTCAFSPSRSCMSLARERTSSRSSRIASQTGHGVGPFDGVHMAAMTATPVRPPSTSMTLPCTKAASGLAR